MALTNTGLVIRRFPEIQQAIRDAMSTSISNELVFDEDTVLGQVVDILSAEVSVVEETVQALYNSLDRDKAEGSPLDSLLYLVGLTRISAATSKGFLDFTTEEGVTIPFESLAENPSSLDRFATTESRLSSISNCRKGFVAISDIQDTADYNITLNGTLYTYTSIVGATGPSIASGIATLINNDPLAVAVASTMVEPDAVILTAKGGVDISIVLETLLTPIKVQISVPAQSIVAGTIKAASDTITNLVTAIGGSTLVTNTLPFGTGRLRESDEEFRLRASSSLAVSGSATFPAMLAAISALDGVSDVTILENSTGTVDANGLPSKSFEVIATSPISAEVDQLIASTIWAEKPIGIETYGNTAVNILDSTGTTRTLNFSRPEEIFYALRVSYSLYDEEIFPTTGEILIKDSVLSTASNLINNEDIILKRFMGGIYNTVAGIDDLIIEAQVIPTATSTPLAGSWSEAKIVIAAVEVSNLPALQVFIQTI